jgi:circadian clock protein KaiC
VNNRLSSGNQRLDDIMHGGLLKNGINLIVGVPGSGKTILSQQFTFANATRERPALYLSTLSEPLDKILRYGEGFQFFDHDALRDGRVIYEDIGPVLGEHGLEDVLKTIDGYLKELRPGIVVIDSFRIFHAFATDITDFRRFLYDLTRRLSASSTTSVWNAPYTKAQALEEAEFAVADGIIALDIKLIGEREIRTLQVLKLRGSDYKSGEHAYQISSAGFRVFPRLADTVDESSYELSRQHTATGIGALDELLGERGYWAGATTLIAGPSGIGKTLMGLHFIYQGARDGEPGVLATFQENRSQLARVVESFGWSVDAPDVHILHRSVVAMDIDEWVYELLDLAAQAGAKRIVVDSLADVMSAASDPVRFREWMFSLAQRCTRAGIGLMLIMEVPELFSVQRVSDESISHLSDNIVLLQYVQEGPELVRALTVLKTRAMRHRPVVHRYDITAKGFVLGDELTISR